MIVTAVRVMARSRTAIVSYPWRYPGKDCTAMNYEIKHLDDPPVVIGIWKEGFRYVENGPDYVREVHALWNSLTTPAFYILDLSRLDAVTFEGLVKAAYSGTRGSSASLHHPTNRGTIFVSSAVLVKAGAKGMDSEVYGNVHIDMFETLDQALAHVRSIIRTEQSKAG
jgi:hypothetical protein